MSGPTSDVQDAIDGAETGDTVAIPPGAFDFDGSVSYEAGITVVGSGPAETVLEKSGSSTDAFFVVDCSNEEPFDIRRR